MWGPYKTAAPLIGNMYKERVLPKRFLMLPRKEGMKIHSVIWMIVFLSKMNSTEVNNHGLIVKEQIVATYIWLLVVEEVVMISNKPSFPPMRYYTTTTLFVEPAHLARVIEG